MRVVSFRSLAAAVLGIFAIAVFLVAAPAPPREQSAATAPATAAPGTPAASEMVLVLDPDKSKVHFSVDSTLHTVHGTFNLKSGSMHFDPATGKAGGEITVFATSGDSGNNSRDSRMHKEILETAKYQEIVFHPAQIEGKVTTSGACDVVLHGMLSIHGGDHELAAHVHVVLGPDHWTGTSTFEVPYVSWGIKDPSKFMLKVKPVVNVEMEMSGTAQPASR